MHDFILYSNTAGPHMRGHLNPSFGTFVGECVDELENCERASELVAVIAMVVVMAMVHASLNEVSLERC